MDETKTQVLDRIKETVRLVNPSVIMMESIYAHMPLEFMINKDDNTDIKTIDIH